MLPFAIMWSSVDLASERDAALGTGQRPTEGAERAAEPLVASRKNLAAAEMAAVPLLCGPAAAAGHGCAALGSA